MLLKLTRNNQDEFIEQIKRLMFYFSAIIIALAELIDLIFIDRSKLLLAINIAISIAMIGSLFLYSFRIVKLKNAISIVIYFILADLFISPFLRIYSPDIGLYFLRLSLAVFAIIPYAGFAIHKKHIIIIGILYLIDYILVAILSDNEFLIKGMSVFILANFAFVSGMYFLISNLMKALEIQKQLLHEADSVNKKLRSKKNKLKQAINSKNKLFSIISHDLKSPFNSILGFAELGIKNTQRNKQKICEKHFRFIKQSAQHSYLLLLNLLDWSSSERGDLLFSPETIKVKGLFNDVLSQLQFEADKKEITIQLDMDDNLNIFADNNMLSSIIRNLVTNAIKFSSIKGKINLSAKERNNGTLLHFSDNGTGLSENKLKHFFSQRRQKPEIGTNNEKGSGLGLLICKDFVKIHKGKIWAENNVSSGLSVFISLPGINE